MSGDQTDGDGETPATRPLRTNLKDVTRAIQAADAAGFVAVGRLSDADCRYLSRVTTVDAACALVVRPERETTPPRAVLCVDPQYAASARRAFVDASAPETTDPSEPAAFHDGVMRSVWTENAGAPPGVKAVQVLSDAMGEPGQVRGDVLTSPTIPHDAAVYLERAGATLVSTTAVKDAQQVKSPAAIARVRRVQRAATAGMACAETVLSRSTPAGVDEDGGGGGGGGGDGRGDGGDGGDRGDGGNNNATTGPPLRWKNEPLTPARLRRAVNATLSARGVTGGEATSIRAGQSAAHSPQYGGAHASTPIRTGETVVVALSPRGPDGYHGALTRTFVVESDGGWERRAYVAVEAAREAALEAVTADAPAVTVHGEAAAELAAYGFDPDADPGAAGFTHNTGGGIGLRRRELPVLPSDAEITSGHVLVVAPSVVDPAQGGVRLGDVVRVTADGYELLAPYPLETTPRDRMSEDDRYAGLHAAFV